ncbi:MAG TPA: polysaccharide deacetylase family protein [Nitrospiraceae bacterium]
MRLDRFITLNIAQPFRRLFKVQGSRFKVQGFGGNPSLPILMYHSISRRDESHMGDYFKLCTPPERFRLQMETLKEHGYIGTDLETGLAQLNSVGVASGQAIQKSSNLGPRTSDLCPSAALPVVLTFDDGFRDFHTEALPVLAEFGFTATMFLATDFIKDERRSFSGTECMTWSEVRECRKFGTHFGSHTVSHAKLIELDWPEIESEISNSKSEIEHQLGARSTSFAYPYAFPQVDKKFCRRLRETLVATGHQSCVTTIAGRVAVGDDPYTLRRLPVNAADDSALLTAKLAGSYDWLAAPQALVKKVKAWKTRRRSPASPSAIEGERAGVRG